MIATASKKTQADALHGPNLILDVEHFGPIAAAKNIELKPMTVFVGPSNTGKSYLAVLLHAFLQAANSDDGQFAYSDFLRSFRHEQVSISSYASLKRDIVRQSIENDSHDINPRSFLSRIRVDGLEYETRQFITQIISFALGLIEDGANNEIIDYFDLKNEPKSSSRQVTYNTETRISLRGARYTLDLTDPKTLRNSTAATGVLHVPLRQLDIWNNQEDSGETELTSRDINYLDRILARYIQRQFKFLSRSFYIPTGRTGIMNAHRVLTSQIVKSAHRFGLETKDNINYHRLARDFLTLLIDLGDLQVAADDRRSPTSDNRYLGISRMASVADLIERSLIQGEIAVTVPEVGLPDFEYVRDSVITPMFRASSMVTELAPIFMVLRHYVQAGDVLIIDEPESHLHPEAQQQMAAALAFMVRSGLRVLITTHSHYMVEQLGNFVAASKLEGDLRKRVLKLDGAFGKEDIYLNESETAVYNFATDDSENGSIVSPVNFDTRRHGFFPKDHNWSIADQMNRTQRVIQASIAKRKNAST